VQLIDDDGYPSPLYGDLVVGAGDAPPAFTANQRVVAFLTMQQTPAPAISEDWSVSYCIRALFPFDGEVVALADQGSMTVTELNGLATPALEAAGTRYMGNVYPPDPADDQADSQ